VSRLTRLETQLVEFIPELLEPGVLYVSQRFSTASHRCACGCGREVVTPLNPAKWRLSGAPGAASLSPSVGNWAFACRSHYWIEAGRVRWAGAMSEREIAAVQTRDRRDAETYARTREGWLRRTGRRFAGGLERLLGFVVRK
jgi:hypothetical protein